MSHDSPPPSATSQKATEAPSFEESLEALHQIVAQLETGSLSLDDTIRKFREGSELAAKCLRQLDEAELRVTELTMEASLRPADMTSDEHS